MKLENFSKRSGLKINNFLYQERLKRLQRTTGMRHMVLDQKRNIAVPVITTLQPGMEVIGQQTGEPIPYLFGGADENIGVVMDIGNLIDPNNGTPLVRVRWPEEFVYNHRAENLLAYVDYQAWLAKSGKPPQPEPKYHVDQVLFIKPGPRMHGSREYPAIGTPYETDVKVTKVTVSLFGSIINYQIYIPNMGYRNLKEQLLASVSERERMLHNDFKEYFVTEDLLPFFKRGERVKSYDGHIYNVDESTVVQLNDELRKYLSWSIKPKE